MISKTYRKLSLGNKLNVIILFVTVVALFIALTVKIIFDTKKAEQDLINRIDLIAKIIGDDLSYHIVFDKSIEAKEYLEKKVASIPEVQYTKLYNIDRVPVCEYNPYKTTPKLFGLMENEHIFYSSSLHYKQAIYNRGIKVGSIYLVATAEEMKERIIKDLRLSFTILVIIMILSLFLANRVHKSITRPISELTDYARNLSSDKDITFHEHDFTNSDSLGILFKEFTKMTKIIKKREREKNQLNELLEKRVLERTLKLENINTELETTNRELIQAKEEAEYATRAKSEFLANMSHEIRTPLNAVIGFTDLLTELVEDSKQQSYLESIKSSGANLLTLINDILDLSKIEAGKMLLNYEPQNLKKILNEIKHIFSIKVENKSIEFKVNIDKDLPEKVIIDEVRVRQILFNLIGNAIKFTNKGAVTLDVKLLSNNRVNEEIDIRIDVIDTGIGIQESSLKKIFDAFVQQDGHNTKKFGGTGLGLAITKRLIEMMGGEISVESEFGSGSTFTVKLYNVKTLVESSKKDEIELTNFDGLTFDNKTVLIADDIYLNRKLIEEFLDLPGITTYPAENGEEVIVRAEKYKPDLILMDIRMPILNGIEATKVIKSNPNLKDTKVVAVTASGFYQDIDKLFENGFEGYLRKPITRESLLSEVIIHLDYQIIKEETEESVSDIETSTIPFEVENKVELQAKLKELIDQKWDSVKNNGFINEISEFATELISLSNQYSCGYLTHYGEKLLEYSNSLDIEKMDAHILKFDEILDRVS